MKQILKGGTVVTGSGSFREDVLIDGEKVAAVAVRKKSRVWRTRTPRWRM